MIRVSDKKKITKKKINKRAVSCLAAAVLFSSAAFTSNVMALESRLVCGQTEHTHSENCYTSSQTLTCSLSEGDNHAHSASCYRTVSNLVCSKVLHTHASSCYVSVSETSVPVDSNKDETAQGMNTESEGNEESNTDRDDRDYNEGAEPGSENDSGSPSEKDSESDCGHDSGSKAEAGENTGSGNEPETGADSEKEWESDSAAESDRDNGSDNETEKESAEEPIPVPSGDRNADLENAEIWEESVAGVVLTGTYARDLVAVAVSQLGNKESSSNYVVNSQNEKKGYTRYGAWWGNPYGDWCAMFVSFCLNYADIPKEQMPRYANCYQWTNALKSRGQFASAGSYQPKVGDIIYFDWNGDKVPDHVGIVYQLSLASDGSVTGVTTIEGNCSNMVKTKNYSISSRSIYGYGILPEGKRELLYETEEFTVSALVDSAGIPDELELCVEVITEQEAEDLYLDCREQYAKLQDQGEMDILLQITFRNGEEIYDPQTEVAYSIDFYRENDIEEDFLIIPWHEVNLVRDEPEWHEVNQVHDEPEIKVEDGRITFSASEPVLLAGNLFNDKTKAEPDYSLIPYAAEEKCRKLL